MEIPRKNIALLMRMRFKSQKKKEEEQSFNTIILNHLESFKKQFIRSLNFFPKNGNISILDVEINVNDIIDRVQPLEKLIDEYLISKDYHKFSKQIITKSEFYSRKHMRGYIEIKYLKYTINLV
jgi:hypothetical protein